MKHYKCLQCRMKNSTLIMPLVENSVDTLFGEFLTFSNVFLMIIVIIIILVIARCYYSRQNIAHSHTITV